MNRSKKPPRKAVAILVFAFDRKPFVIQLIHETISALCAEDLIPSVIISRSPGPARTEAAQFQLIQPMLDRLDPTHFILVSLPQLPKDVFTKFCKDRSDKCIVALDVDPLPHVKDENLPHNLRFVGTDNVAGARLAFAELMKRAPDGKKNFLVLGASLQPQRSGQVSLLIEETGATAQKEDFDLKDKRLRENVFDYVHGVDTTSMAGVFGATDEIALAASDALEQDGSSLPVVGFDGLPVMLELMRRERRKTLVATVEQMISSIAIRAVNHVADSRSPSGRDLVLPRIVSRETIGQETVDV